MDILGRIDFSITPLLVDEDNRHIKLRIEPHADRYKVVEIKGESGYLDLYSKRRADLLLLAVIALRDGQKSAKSSHSPP